MTGEIELDLRSQAPLFEVEPWKGFDGRTWAIHVTPVLPFSQYQPMLQLVANMLTRWKFRLYPGDEGGFTVCRFEVENRQHPFAPYEAPIHGLQVTWDYIEKPSEVEHTKLEEVLALWVSVMKAFSFHRWLDCPLDRLRPYVEMVLANELEISPKFFTAFARVEPDPSLVGFVPPERRYWQQ